MNYIKNPHQAYFRGNIKVIGTRRNPLFHFKDVAAYIGDDNNMLKSLRTLIECNKTYVIKTAGEYYVTDDALYEYLLDNPKAKEFREYAISIL